MVPEKRFGFSAMQKSDMWSRWKAGQSRREIGRAFGKAHSSIRCVVSRHGRVIPAIRGRSVLEGSLPVPQFVRQPDQYRGSIMSRLGLKRL